jgi:hypothetical protein
MIRSETSFFHPFLKVGFINACFLSCFTKFSEIRRTEPQNPRVGWGPLIIRASRKEVGMDIMEKERKVTTFVLVLTQTHNAKADQAIGKPYTWILSIVSISRFPKFQTQCSLNPETPAIRPHLVLDSCKCKTKALYLHLLILWGVSISHLVCDDTR